VGRGRAYGLGPIQKDKFCFFVIFSSTKTISEIPENAYKARKYSKNPKNSTKTPKVFGSHEKDFRAF
jgi:hypothetical protein